MRFIKYFTISLIITFISTSFGWETNPPSTKLLKETYKEKIIWHTWEEAIELNKKEPKNLFIDVYTKWCGYCKKMDRSTFTDPKIAAYINKNFYAIKLDAEQKEDINFNGQTFSFVKTKGRGKGIHVLAYSLLDGKLSYPSIVYMNSDIERIMLAPGYKTPKQLMPELVFAQEKQYKNKSYEAFLKNYK